MNMNPENLLPLLMPLLMILIFIGAIAFSLVYAKRRKERALKMAAETAAACGLEFRDGREALPDAASMTEVPSVLQGFLRSLLARGAAWNIVGQRDGQAIRVYPETRSSGKSSTTYVIVTVSYERPLPFEIRIAKEGIFTKLGKAVSLMTDIETGDPEFDPLIRVKTKDEASAAALLADTGRRAALVALIRALPGAWADKDHLHWERVADCVGAEELQSVLSAMLPAARSLSQ